MGSSTSKSRNQKLKTPIASNGSANKIGPSPEKVKKRLDRLTGNDSGSRPNSAGSSSSRAENLRRRLNRMSSTAERLFHDEVDAVLDKAENISDIPYQSYEYPFENLVFEGGGAKGQVYIGCLEVLDEVGIKPKRFAGASAGALCATMLAAGYTTAELKEVLQMNLDEILIDHTCGLCSLLPNLLQKFGWNPGNRFYDFLGELLKKKLGNPDVTFKQLYKLRGVELCITAVNLNMSSVEYFHPKTSPNMPIRKAARISVSIPGIFQAVELANDFGDMDVYIDGGVLCNYPIHCFDGWWLSMDVKNSFLNKLQPLSQLHKLMDKKERFADYNEKTLGFLVYSALEQDLMQTELESRAGLVMTERPLQSKLYRSRAVALQSKEEALAEHQVFLNALDLFMKTLKIINQQAGTRADDVIDKKELKEALILAMSNTLHKYDGDRLDCGSDDMHEQHVLTAAHIEILFGTNTLDEIFKELDTDESGYISYDELMSYIERSGVNIQARFQGYSRKPVGNIQDFVVGLQDCLLTNVKKMFLENRDLERTVGINTDYVETTDFKMEKCDKEFLVEQGRRATIAYLKNYVYQNKNKVPMKQPDLNMTVTTTVSSSSDGEDTVDGKLRLNFNKKSLENTSMNRAAALTDHDNRVVLPPIRGTIPSPRVEKSPRLLRNNPVSATQNQSGISEEE